MMKIIFIVLGIVELLYASNSSPTALVLFMQIYMYTPRGVVFTLLIIANKIIRKNQYYNQAVLFVLSTVKTAFPVPFAYICNYQNINSVFSLSTSRTVHHLL